jgi:hypothetical protein
MSLSADAAILLTANSGSWIHNTSGETAPASTQACASSKQSQSWMSSDVLPVV